MMSLRYRIALSWAALALATLPVALIAQNITLKTVPIPTGEQFLLFPSLRLGMGSVSIALDDPVAAPFSNPARRLAEGTARVYASPTFYGETNESVGGRSLPIAALFAGERLHGGFAVALQQVNDSRRNFAPVFNPEGRNFIDNARNNTYLFGTAGGRIGERTSVGVNVFHADLGAVDGVNLLYANAAGISQDGSLLDTRLGFAYDLGEERRLEATITNTRLDMTHDVHYEEWRWTCDPRVPPAQGQPPCNQPTRRSWDELNEDRTVTWGTHLRYSQPIDEVSRLGFMFAASTKDHPKIPNYNIVNIPRDPGNSTVFNIGAGFSHQDGPVSAGLDVIYEPGRSHTWAYADTVTRLPSGATLQPGDKTVDNEFEFQNMSIGLGVERETERFGFQLGLRLRQISYSLDQQHFLAERVRKTDESWMEWMPSWGLVTKLGTLDLRYTGRFTAKGFPPLGIPIIGGFGREETLSAGPVADGGIDFVVGATQAVNMPDYRVTVHRIMLSMPIGRR
jgi:hypothetical protein